MSSPTPDPRQVLRTVFVATFFIRFGFGITVSTFAFYLSTSVASVGLASAAAPIIEFATVLLSGIAADRYGRLPVLKFGLLLGAGMLFLMSTTRDPIASTFLSGFFGLSSGAILAASLAFVGDASGADERGKEMGYFDAVNLLGWVLGFSVGYVLVSALNGIQDPSRLSSSFLVGALAVLAALGVLEFATRGFAPGKTGPAFSWSHIRKAALDLDVLLVVLPWSVIYMLLGALFTFLGPSAEHLSLPPWELGIIIGVGGLVLLVTQPLYGRWADRFGRAPLMSVGIGGFLGVLLAGSLLAVYGLNYGALALLGVSTLAALAFGPSSLAALTDLSRAISRGTTMSLYSLMIALGMAVGIGASSALFTAFQTNGILLFFAGLGVALVGLTAWRLGRGQPRLRERIPPPAQPTP